MSHSELGIFGLAFSCTFGGGKGTVNVY